MDVRVRIKCVRGGRGERKRRRRGAEPMPRELLDVVLRLIEWLYCKLHPASWWSTNKLGSKIKDAVSTGKYVCTYFVNLMLQNIDPTSHD